MACPFLYISIQVVPTVIDGSFYRCLLLKHAIMYIKLNSLRMALFFSCFLLTICVIKVTVYPHHKKMTMKILNKTLKNANITIVADKLYTSFIAPNFFDFLPNPANLDRKSTRLNSSH